MVYTITLNTAIDEVIVAKTNIKHSHNQIIEKTQSVGGKAIKTNVLLSKYGYDNIALGFVGGDVGKSYQQLLKGYNVKTEFVNSNSYKTRVSTIIVDCQFGGSTMFVEQAQGLVNDDIKQFFTKVETIEDKALVLVAGSLPTNFKIEHFEKLLKTLKQKKCKIICDVSGEQLKAAIKMQVDFIKPNEHEFEDLFNLPATYQNVQTKLGHLPAFAVSLGSKGCIYKDNGNVKRITISPLFAKENKIKSTTGCGDLFIAGYILAILSNQRPIIKATTYSMAKTLAFGSEQIDEQSLEKLKKYIGE